MDSIYEFVKNARDEYYSRTIEVVPGYEFSQHETLRTIELYHNSRFLTSNKDSLGREKPFFNICKFRVNVAVQATDLDTKDVQIQSENEGSYAQSFLLSLKNRNWMRDTSFPRLLNRMGQTRAKFGGVLVKKTEHGSDMRLHVVPWRDVITDQVDIESGIKIERHYYSPADLKEMATNAGWQNVDEAIATAQKSQNSDITGKSKRNRTLGANIEVWEVHGVLKDCYLDENKDTPGAENTYSRQMHIVVLDESEKDVTKGSTLFSGPETDDPYKYLPWEQVDGRGLGVGVIEDLFEAQVWTNYSQKQKKDMLDLAGKIIFQTTDSSIAAKNVLTQLENGSIVTTAANTSLTQVNNIPGSLPGFDELMKDWDQQAERVTSTYDANTGQTLPSGTPFQLAGMLNTAANTVFMYRREEMGIFIEEIYRDWILPFLVKQIQKTNNLVAELTADELAIVSQLVAEFDAATTVKKAILSGQVVTQADYEQMKQTIVTAMSKGGKRRKFTFPKKFFTGDYMPEVITTGEQQNKQAILTSLFSLFQTLVKFPQALNDPTLKGIFNQIMEVSGRSPALVNPGAAKSLPQPSMPPQMQPQASPLPPIASAIPTPTLAPGVGVAA